jgi:hypothetical protein
MVISIILSGRSHPQHVASRCSWAVHSSKNGGIMAPPSRARHRLARGEAVKGRSMGKLLVAMVMLSMFLGCATSPQFYGWPTEGVLWSPPVIEGYYAPKSVAPGSAWNIYLQAKDPDGDMLYIACIIDQTGYGLLDSVNIPLKDNDRAEFYGYVSMPTPPLAPSQAVDISFTMAVLIRDQQGNTSQLIKLFVALAGKAEQAVRSQWLAAAHHHLGDIVVSPNAFTSSGVQGSHKGHD